MKPELFICALAALACTDSQARPSAEKQSERAPATTPVATEAQSHSVTLKQLGGRFRNPLHLTSPAGDPRQFVVEQAGRIIVVKNGSAVSRPFLDISSRVKSGGEQGLLSMAFHPDYRRNGQFFVNFTDTKGDTRVERFTVSSNPDVADESSAKIVITIDQPYSNHNGGHIVFGLDGMLYIGMGDGGSGGDPQGNGQNRRALLGKLLRINVSNTGTYTIPAGNPYANGSAGRQEIWATGLRNPWRFAFDRPTGLLYIADVGQSQQEEVHVEPASKPGLNYGWNRMEGDQCYGRGSCDRNGLQIPQVVYSHSSGGCSITGGHVYRGRRVPSIVGHYFYSDYCAGFLRSFRSDNGRAVDRRVWKMDDIGNVVSFGEDSAGDMYIVAENGRIWRIDSAT